MSKKINKEMRCFQCKDVEMFENGAGGFTCPKCGQLIMPFINPKEHLRLLNLLMDSQERIESRFNETNEIDKAEGDNELKIKKKAKVYKYQKLKKEV